MRYLLAGLLPVFDLGHCSCTIVSIGVGAQATLGGHKIFARKIYIKNQQNARFFMIFARKLYKIPEFYMIFGRKMPEFYIIIARKIFLPEF